MIEGLFQPIHLILILVLVLIFFGPFLLATGSGNDEVRIESGADPTQESPTEFRGLVGVLPGFGRQEPNDWGLGFELRDGKSPHWTGSRNSPRTFGHFGRSGTFLWVDPDAGVALACLTDLPFGDWASDAWPRLADSVLEELEQ